MMYQRWTAVWQKQLKAKWRGKEKKTKNTVCLYRHYQQLSEQVVNNAKSAEIVTNTQARQHRGAAL